jgi:hypothetical protein
MADGEGGKRRRAVNREVPQVSKPITPSTFNDQRSTTNFQLSTNFLTAN